MPRPAKTVVKLEEKVLQFEFNILQVQFNKSGNFFLKLSVQNRHRQDLLSKVTVEVNDNGQIKEDFSASTEAVSWDEHSTVANYEKNNFKFTFPKGFCKNDGYYDVFLLLEAFTSKKGEKMGEASFAIYPRTEMPRANLFARHGEDYYRYSGVLTLLRPLTRSLISMHCGRLSYSVGFHAYREPGQEPSEESQSEEEDYEEIQRRQDEDFTARVEAELAQREAEILRERKERKEREQHERELKEKERELQELLKKPIPSIPPPKHVMNRTTQWTPQQETSRVLFSPSSTITTDEPFHISIPSTPLHDDGGRNIEKTMDSPIEQPVKKSNTRPSKSQSRMKSPTMTSPKSSNDRRGDSAYRHVAPPGYEQIVVIMHAATSLPSRSDGDDPLPFATLKSSSDEQNNRTAQATTHSVTRPTHTPSWEEVLIMEISDMATDNEEMILTVADSRTKEKLVTYRIPLKNLVPFYTYHLELVQPTKSMPSGIRVYATVVRKKSYLPRSRSFHFCGLEVNLRSFHRELEQSLGSLLAVARIVPDYTQYKESILSRNPSLAGITMTTVNFPSPHPSAFEVTSQQMHGFPQISIGSSGDRLPKWDHIYLFSTHDVATMFTHNSALVIEFYAANKSMSAMTWSVRSHVGFAVLLLDDEIFNALTSDAGSSGVRVEDLLVQACSYDTVEGPFPSIRMILRLINTERPDTLISSPESLPALDTMPIPNAIVNRDRPRLKDGIRSPGRGGAHNNTGRLLDVADPASHENSSVQSRTDAPLRPERKRTVLLVKEDEFPPSDILQTILPEYALTENDIHPPPAPLINRTSVNMNEHNGGNSFMEHQTRELENYREAMKRMAADIVHLRNEVGNLQAANSELRRELARNKELGNIVRSDINAGIVTNDEVADKYVSVRQKLNKETDELKKYKGKVQLLQNELIKANDREKQYYLVTAKDKSKKTDDSRMQDKLRKTKRLEETCLQQEKVIQKMEKLLDRYQRNQAAGQGDKLVQNTAAVPLDNQTTSLLTQENIRLRNELQALKMTERGSDAERMQLIARAERAEGRVASLENQLEHNSRRWAKERHELTIRLQEHRNGFLRTDEGYGTTGYLQDSMLK